ncbi:MAG: pyridoxal-phosphate dependent enzyme [Bacteroidetes bacterium]|nr:pyridoxal-phosphate dependent enzyme [Bacteroidota bacterium]
MPYQKLFYESGSPATVKTVPTERLELTEFAEKGVEADVLRLDKIHPIISGNKWFKLKTYFDDAAQKEYETIITFGGAYSNHVIAAAYAAKESGFKSIGIIRGEESPRLSHTLTQAREYGMRLVFINRDKYQDMRESVTDNEDLLQKFPGAYIIPEGGQGKHGVTGSEAILELVQKNNYSHIICAIGTGTMFAGLVNASTSGQYIVGIPVLKGVGSLLEQFGPFLRDAKKIKHCSIQYDYHFGGYAKRKPELIDFMNRIYAETRIPTDFVYTAKMFYAAVDLVTKNYFARGSKLLLIHSGGLQGNLSLSPGTLNF